MSSDLTPLTFVATSDLSAITKGRSMPSSLLEPGVTTGWVPANFGIGASGHIADQIPFGSTGDLRLRPDHDSAHVITGVPGRPDTRLVMADIVHTDGEPWACCPRTFLRDAVATLEQEFGLSVQSAFEHEFMDLDIADDHHPFSWRNFRAAEPVGSHLVTAMERSGLEPETWLPEYGQHQFEITVSRTDAVASADRAILVRDLVRDVFSAAGHRTSFSPVVTPGGSGNGVHVHFGLTDADGVNVMFDATRPGRLTELGGRFAAGILRHAGALAAIFAPLSVSYLRLRPHQWSSAASSSACTTARRCCGCARRSRSTDRTPHLSCTWSSAAATSAPTPGCSSARCCTPAWRDCARVPSRPNCRSARSSRATARTSPSCPVRSPRRWTRSSGTRW